MFDHVSIGVRKLAVARSFYDAALTPLGYDRLSDTETMLGYGPGKISLWIAEVEHPVVPDLKSGLHFCFIAPSVAAVDAFYAAGVAHGGQDNGPPGVRPEYATFYYAAFVIDPDGFRLEAFFHMPE
jgi:catechol 2,3-dioxygenase-like lactoylglutathione lyase family enzyme